MNCIRIFLAACVVLVLATAAMAADFGVKKATFISRFNASAEKQGLKALPIKPMETQHVKDRFGPATLSIHAVSTLVVMLNTYDAKPDTLAALAVINQIDGTRENEVATLIGIDSAISALSPKTQKKNREAIMKALGLDKGFKGSIMDGKKREHVAGKIRYVAGAQQGKGVTFAAYPVK